MPKKLTSKSLKKKNIKIVDDVQDNKKNLDESYQISRIDKGEQNLNENEEIIDDEAIEDEEGYQEEEEELNDTEQDELSQAESDKENQEEEIEEELKKSEDKEHKIEKEEYEEDVCIYNYAENESDEEQELIFDDDGEELISDIVPSNQRISRPFLTKYERNRLKGDRIQQLTLGAKPLIKNSENLSPKEIAELEIENNVIPLIIERPLPDGTKERFYIHELIH